MEVSSLELLAPAKNAETAREAIVHGADAVYIGGPSHGARAAASNDIQDIDKLCTFAHLYGARVYVTLNTIIYDNELEQVSQTVKKLYEAGVDALIVQDMALLELDLPPIDLHASTQCDIRTPEKARFLADCGFSQLVLPREFTLEEIRATRAVLAPDTKIEAFVHGALCVSYSGDCQASYVAKNRSANRGECAQMCRLPYTLTDKYGTTLIKDKHLLSLRDLNRISQLAALADAGVSSFKIEGRLKDTSYVKTVVSAYRQALDNIITTNPEKYARASYGTTLLHFHPSPEKAFNRGFTTYFTNGLPTCGTKMANFDTPKHTGEKIGTVKKCAKGTIIAKIDKPLNNGDGLGYYTPDGTFTGFRLNKTEGNTLYPASRVDIPIGTVLYRNRDVKTDSMMAGKTAERTISVKATLDKDAESIITLTFTAENGIKGTAQAHATTDTARTPQKEPRQKNISKLGATPYRLEALSDNLDQYTFLPPSALTDLRQRACDDLTYNILSAHTRRERIRPKSDAAYPHQLTYHDNVANRLARKFYESHGAQIKENAIETTKPSPHKPLTVMTTRYCLRRELGACLKDKNARQLPDPLYITNDTATYRLKFDCANCQMQLITASPIIDKKK